MIVTLLFFAGLHGHRRLVAGATAADDQALAAGPAGRRACRRPAGPRSRGEDRASVYSSRVAGAAAELDRQRLCHAHGHGGLAAAADAAAALGRIPACWSLSSIALQWRQRRRAPRRPARRAGRAAGRRPRRAALPGRPVPGLAAARWQPATGRRPIRRTPSSTSSPRCTGCTCSAGSSALGRAGARLAAAPAMRAAARSASSSAPPTGISCCSPGSCCSRCWPMRCDHLTSSRSAALPRFSEDQPDARHRTGRYAGRRDPARPAGGRSSPTGPPTSAPSRARPGGRP